MSVSKLRFKREDGTDYPEWEEKKISDICEPHARIGWQNLRTDEFLDEGDYYLVTGTDFLNGRVNFVTCHYIDRERFEQDKNIQITNGDILITKDGTLGKIALVENMDKEGTLNAGVFVLQNLTPNIYNLYLYQYLTAPYLLDFAFDKATGGTIKHLNQGILVQFPVPIPCLEEQRKIADFLSAVDEVIAQSEAEVQNLEQQKKAAMQKIFSQEVRFKREDGTEYPEWKTDIVGNRITVYDKKVATNCTLPILTSSKTNGIEYQSDHFGREQNHDIDGYNVIPRGYATYRNRSDNRDFTFNINNICDEGIISKFYPVFTSYNCNLIFLIYLLNNSPSIVKEIGYTAIGTGQKVLSISDFKSIKILIPDIEEQQKIADFLSAYDEAISYAKQELDKWKELKKGLLQQMFV